MKLRITSESLRFRVLRPEVAALIETGRIEETIYFGEEGQCGLTYSLLVERGLSKARLRYQPSEIAICLPLEEATVWADTDQIGIYATICLGRRGNLALIVEKDFACLDLSDADNRDTFPNPQIGVVC